ncbi:hypothetical protein N431DRAFT_436669 [Stipitochalara longipes BDJ]|nr:hypothetical protein N431DRAFT_436669 [Stipitochalara longipes BDJ]
MAETERAIAPALRGGSILIACVRLSVGEVWGQGRLASTPYEHRSLGPDRSSDRSQFSKLGVVSAGSPLGTPFPDPIYSKKWSESKM